MIPMLRTSCSSKVFVRVRGGASARSMVDRCRVATTCQET
jgi:hypothetical protein